MPAEMFVTYDSEDKTVDATSGGVSLTASKIRDSRFRRALLRVETAQIRVSAHGASAVTATANGFKKDVDEEFFLTNSNEALAFRAIRTGGASGKLHVEYQGQA